MDHHFPSSIGCAAMHKPMIGPDKGRQSCLTVSGSVPDLVDSRRVGSQDSFIAMLWTSASGRVVSSRLTL
ncbi:hypothetical protein RB2492 [Rhodopirellula baltica SH 1]|uniref:Uncharacterized protein n=1 Tax=Rhodopirellula baltica (strain DSM 10527 / NCIMB 13988 / SH1) TaxID=243090 RepID=Q7UVQ8_RHOBA|nr:hypothetical protein RB2492 [Rhodopirellula baltica SH 1]